MAKKQYDNYKEAYEDVSEMFTSLCAKCAQYKENNEKLAEQIVKLNSEIKWLEEEINKLLSKEK